MAVTYNTLLRQLAIVVNALVGTQPDPLQATYATIPLTAANFDSSTFPFLFFLDKLLNAQEGLILAIASTGNHPWREFIGANAVTGPLVPGARIPATDSLGAQIVGLYGAVRDSADSNPLTQKKLQQIRDRLVNPNGMWVVPVYWFCMEDRRIYHTRPAVAIDVCTYTRPSADSLDLTTNILLPDVLGPAIVDGAAMECVRDDEFLVQSGRFGEYYAAWITAIKQGLTSVDAKTTPKLTEKIA